MVSSHEFKLSNPLTHLVTDHELSMFKSHQKYMLLNSDYPLSHLYNMRNLLKKVREDEEKMPKVSLTSDDCQTVVVDNIAASLDGIGNIFQGILQDIRDAKSSLSNHHSEGVHGQPQQEQCGLLVCDHADQWPYWLERCHA